MILKNKKNLNKLFYNKYQVNFRVKIYKSLQTYLKI
jgi:hypothetical protein